jgi:hypothetical protein
MEDNVGDLVVFALIQHEALYVKEENDSIHTPSEHSHDACPQRKKDIQSMFEECCR